MFRWRGRPGPRSEARSKLKRFVANKNTCTEMSVYRFCPRCSRTFKVSQRQGVLPKSKSDLRGVGLNSTRFSQKLSKMHLSRNALRWLQYIYAFNVSRSFSRTLTNRATSASARSASFSISMASLKAGNGVAPYPCSHVSIGAGHALPRDTYLPLPWSHT